MNENAKKWIEALRSGEFSQTTNRLHDDKGLCCLGVATELYRQATGLGEWRKPTDASHKYYFCPPLGIGEASSLVQPVMKWLGIKTNEGLLQNDKTLANLNDDGMTFERKCEKGG